MPKRNRRFRLGIYLFDEKIQRGMLRTEALLHKGLVMTYWKLFAALLVLLFGYGVYYNYHQIHRVVAPHPVTLSLGEQNRNERLIFSGYREFKTLPKSAWCEQSSWSDDTLTFNCLWPTPAATTHFASGTVSISLPSKEVYSWNFDRRTLSAVPDMHSWLTVNSDNMMACFFLFLFALISLILSLPDNWSPEEILKELDARLA
jgi:hypothetical protein